LIFVAGNNSKWQRANRNCGVLLFRRAELRAILANGKRQSAIEAL
jgi:hypothetical protein